MKDRAPVTRDDCLKKLRAWITDGGKGGMIQARKAIETYLSAHDRPQEEAKALRRDIVNWNPFKSGNRLRLVKHLVAHLDGWSNPPDSHHDGRDDLCCSH